MTKFLTLSAAALLATGVAFAQTSNSDFTPNSATGATSKATPAPTTGAPSDAERSNSRDSTGGTTNSGTTATGAAMHPTGAPSDAERTNTRDPSNSKGADAGTMKMAQADSAAPSTGATATTDSSAPTDKPMKHHRHHMKQTSDAGNSNDKLPARARASTDNVADQLNACVEKSQGADRQTCIQNIDRQASAQ